MSFERIAGLLISGFACRAYAAGFAVWAGCEAYAFVIHAFGMIDKAF